MITTASHSLSSFMICRKSYNCIKQKFYDKSFAVTEIICSGIYQDTCAGCLFNGMFSFPAEVAIHRHYRSGAVLKLGQLQVLSCEICEMF